MVKTVNLFLFFFKIKLFEKGIKHPDVIRSNAKSTYTLHSAMPLQYACPVIGIYIFKKCSY
jgi:hypothetical protein